MRLNAMCRMKKATTNVPFSLLPSTSFRSNRFNFPVIRRRVGCIFEIFLVLDRKARLRLFTNNIHRTNTPSDNSFPLILLPISLTTILYAADMRARTHTKLPLRAITLPIRYSILVDSRNELKHLFHVVCLNRNKAITEIFLL